RLAAAVALVAGGGGLPLGLGKLPLPRRDALVVEGVGDRGQQVGLVLFHRPEPVPFFLLIFSDKSRWQNIASPPTSTPSSWIRSSISSAALCSLVLASTGTCSSTSLASWAYAASTRTPGTSCPRVPRSSLPSMLTSF